MATTKRILKFTMPVALMWEKAQAMHAHYVADLATWTATNPVLTAAWGNAFQTAIDNAQSATMPVQNIAQVKIETQDVHEQEAKMREVMQKLLPRVKIAFAGDKALQQAFGTHLYRDAT